MANGKQQFAVIDNGQHVRNTVAGSAEGAINSYARSTKQNSTKYIRAVAIQETYRNPKAIELLCIESIRFDAEDTMPRTEKLDFWFANTQKLVACGRGAIAAACVVALCREICQGARCENINQALQQYYDAGVL